MPAHGFGLTAMIGRREVALVDPGDLVRVRVQDAARRRWMVIPEGTRWQVVRTGRGWLARTRRAAQQMAGKLHDHG